MIVIAKAFETIASTTKTAWLNDAAAAEGVEGPALGAARRPRLLLREPLAVPPHAARARHSPASRRGLRRRARDRAGAEGALLMSDSDQSAAVSPLTVAADDVADFAEHGTGALPAERAGMRRLVALVEAIEDDPAAFWPMITRAQALALLGAAPRVAGEWVPDDRHGRSGARYTKTPVGSLAMTGKTPTVSVVHPNKSVVHPNKRFCANLEPDLKCPKCGETTVFVREHETYRDGDEYEAYCDSCDTALQVAAYVTVEFSDPEFVDVD